MKSNILDLVLHSNMLKVSKFMKPLVSIVMPVYNAEKYLPQSLSSILEQSYSDIELICVDDGSTDSSLKLLEEYAKKDSRMKIIQQQNQYAGVARNRGMESASGKYLMFLDADDIFEKNMISDLVKISEKKNPDVIMFGYYRFTKSLKTRRYTKVRYKSKNMISPQEISDSIFQIAFGVPWNKFFNTEFVKNTGLKFQDLKNNNDEFFCKMVVLEAERILFMDKAYVNYRIANKDSLQGSVNSSSRNFAKALAAMYTEMEQRGKLDMYGSSYYRFAASLSMEALLRANSYKSCIECINAIENLIQIIGHNSWSATLNGEEKSVMDCIMNHDIDEAMFFLIQLLKRDTILKSCVEYRIGAKLLDLLRIKRF